MKEEPGIIFAWYIRLRRRNRIYAQSHTAFPLHFLEWLSLVKKDLTVESYYTLDVKIFIKYCYCTVPRLVKQPHFQRTY
jgi:hypothetical protein